MFAEYLKGPNWIIFYDYGVGAVKLAKEYMAKGFKVYLPHPGMPMLISPVERMLIAQRRINR